MTRFDRPRFGLALLGGGVAALLCVLLGGGPGPVILAAILGGLGLWFGLRRPDDGPALPPVAAEPPAEEADFDLQAILDAIDDPVLIVSGQIVIRANGAARALLGAHILGEDVRLAIRHPAATERLTGRGGDRAAAAADGPIELVGLGERERRWELVVHPLGARDLIVRLADRTGTYAAERMRVDFVANASHELRTPLATLLGFIETLEDNNTAEDAATRKRFLKIMFGEAKRMQRLVDDLMSLSRIEAEKYSAPQTALRLEPLIREVRSSLRTGIVADAERILVDAAPDTPPVAGDRAQLSQLLHNIIGNAIKYGRPGSPVRVTLAPAGGDAGGNMVRLCVADEGEGVAAEHLPRLTERFYRVDPGRSRTVGGTGLGLSIVKHVVERHRGRLDIESVVGSGTTVTVLLPAAPHDGGKALASALPAALSSNGHASVTQSEPDRSSDRIDPA